MSHLAVNAAEEEIEAGKGYYLGISLGKDELNLMRSLIEAHWLKNIEIAAPTALQKFSEIGMTRYHELSHCIDHTSLWTKKNRILPQEAVTLIRSMPFFKSLKEIYGDFKISAEEGVENEEIYWRLVRPSQSSDMGPLHADAWFWELDHGKTPPDVTRIKVWIAIYCDPGLNGLRVVPHSQKKNWKYHGEYRDGFSKPQIDEDESTLPVMLVDTKPGDAIVFHDRLLHGGALNKSENTRVSVEFTLFVKNK